MMASLSRPERELRHAIPRAKPAAALRGIRLAAASRFTSRSSRAISAAFAWRADSAVTEPAARYAVHPGLYGPELNPNSVATSHRPPAAA
jgi:hypothetical protein